MKSVLNESFKDSVLKLYAALNKFGIYYSVYSRHKNNPIFNMMQITSIDLTQIKLTHKKANSIRVISEVITLIILIILI
jgi:hypothetical protein